MGGPYASDLKRLSTGLLVIIHLNCFTHVHLSLSLDFVGRFKFLANLCELHYVFISSTPWTQISLFSTIRHIDVKISDILNYVSYLEFICIICMHQCRCGDTKPVNLFQAVHSTLAGEEYRAQKEQNYFTGVNII